MIPISILIQGSHGTGKSRLMAELVCGTPSITKTKVIDAQDFILTPYEKLKTDILYLIDAVEDGHQTGEILKVLADTKVKCIATTQLPVSDILRVTAFSDSAKYISLVTL